MSRSSGATGRGRSAARRGCAPVIATGAPVSSRSRSRRGTGPGTSTSSSAPCASGNAAAPVRRHAVAAAGRTLVLGERPWLMGIVNASPGSFSHGGAYPDLDARVRRARALLDAGADIIDVGGESGITRRPAVAAAAELERGVPLVERIAGELGALVSVDTYKPAVAEAAIAAGAAI